MSEWRLLLILVSIGAFVVPTGSLMTCGQCERRILNGELICPHSQSDQRYTVQLHDIEGYPRSLFYLKCRYNAQAIDFSLIADCDFSLVQQVQFQWCPLPNTSFSQLFEQIGINPQNVTSFSFTNVGQRQDPLQEWHLENLTNLKTLDLKNNGFSSLPPHVFDGNPNLERLFLTLNSIDTLPESLFRNTPNLTVLELQNNGLTILPVGLFTNLTNLKNISLWENRLSQLQPELLSNAPNLMTLELTRNEISHLEPDVFASLKDIRRILIGTNRLRSLPESVFHHCPHLENLEFDNNGISALPEEIFRESTKMKRLIFNNNDISQLPEKLLSSMKDLENLQLKRNAIFTLPPRLFEGLTKLEVLDLQSNVISELPPGVFDDLVKVDTLVLKNNSLHELPGDIFQNCASLLRLHLSHNALSTLLPTMFPNSSEMTLLDLSSNNISFLSHSTKMLNGTEHVIIQEYFPLSHLTGLTRLFLKNNTITEIPQALGSELENLLVLDLSNNLITYVDHNDLSFKSGNLKVDLRNNKIKVINTNHMNFSSSRRFLEIYIEGNPLVCNCELYSFAMYVQGKFGHESGIDVYDAYKANCTNPEKTNNVSPLLKVKTESLKCKLQDCIENCTCSTRAWDKMLLVDCSYQGLESIPALTRAHIPDDDDYRLTLILKNNSITNLDGLEDGDYERLVNLSIAFNKVNFINESCLPEALEFFDIRGNNISSLTTSTLQFLNSTDMQLSLGNNPWVCDCETAELHAFLRDPDRKIPDIHNVKCAAFGDEALINLTEADLCPLIQQPLVIAAITSVGILLLVFATLATLSFYKYKQDIKVWLFTHHLCLWAVTEEEEDADKKYDAFISYSSKDEEYVNSVLVPGLESKEPKYKVCLHYRDWLPGEYIQNQIDQSIEASRRTIVVLSSNFIENVWGHIEFKTAHSKALKDRTNRIIVLVLGEVPPESELDEELKLYLSTRTYLDCKDVKFWEKLRYAMPHPPALMHKKRKKGGSEKLELSKTNCKQQIV